MRAEELYAQLSTLADDVPVTLPAGALRAVLDELRSEADAEIGRWLDAVD